MTKQRRAKRTQVVERRIWEGEQRKIWEIHGTLVRVDLLGIQ